MRCIDVIIIKENWIDLTIIEVLDILVNETEWKRSIKYKNLL